MSSASSRGNAVNVRKDATKLNRGGKTQNKSASRPGRAANAQNKIANKPTRAVKTQNKAANSPNLGGKAADDEVVAVAEDVANNGTIKVKAVVAVDAVAVMCRIVSAGGNANENRSAMIAQRPKCAKLQVNRRRRANRSRSRRP